VEKRQSEDDQAITKRFLFGLNPERMYPRYRQVESDLDATERSSLSESSSPRNTSRILDKQSATNLARSIEPTQVLSTISQERHQDQVALGKQEGRGRCNTLSEVSESSSLPTEASSEEELLDSAESAMIIKIPCVNWNQSHVSFAVEFDVADLESATSNKTRRGEALSESDETIDCPPNSDSMPFATQRTFYVLPSSHVAPFASYYDHDYYEDHDYSRSNPDHVIYKSTYTRGDSMDTVALSDVSRTQQFSDMYNYPMETRYTPLPNARRHHYVTPVRTYARVPLYRAFSSPAYY